MVGCIVLGRGRRQMTALQDKIDTLEHYANKSDVNYDIGSDSYNGRTIVTIENAWNQFEVRLGPRGGLRRAEYDTTGWGDGNMVDRYDTKNEAWSTLLTAVEKPNPIEA